MARLTPPGLPVSLDYPDVPVWAILLGAARRWPDRVAYHLDGVELRFADVLARAARFAHALRAAGIGRGDVVALHMLNCLEYPIAYYGTLLGGAAFSPANPLLPPADLAFQLTDCSAAAVVTGSTGAAVVEMVREQTPAKLVVGVDTEPGAADVAFEEFLGGHPTEPPAIDIDVRHDLAHLAYTTGRSKGVQLPHRNVVVNTPQYACWGSGGVPALDDADSLILDKVGSPDEWPVRLGTGVMVNLTPWFHAMGTVGYLNVPVLIGATLVLHRRFDPGHYLADAARFRVTMIGGAPPIFVALLRHPDIDTVDLSSVRSISSGAAPLPVEVLKKLHKRFRMPSSVRATG